MSHTTSYFGLTPHPDGVVHERLPMANVAKITHNIDLPLPGIIKSPSPKSYHIPSLSRVSTAKASFPAYPSELHHEAGPAPKTKTTPGMIALERRA